MTTDALLVEEWRGLLSRYSKVAHELDRALQAKHGLTMSDYEVLDRIVASTDCKARAAEILADLHLSQSALSRAVARMEKCGLVARSMCVTDRRGVNVTATEQGRALQAEARETQLAVLRECLGAA